MRQVPHYLIIGNGRVAHHFNFYFKYLGVSHANWHRGLSLSRLEQEIPPATHILVLISDDMIQDFSATYLVHASAIKIHFSGSLVLDSIYGAHPLMTFNAETYHADFYRTIPFIIDDDAPEFSQLLPGLLNNHVRLAKTLKAKYHALCVLSGNFSCMLWQKLFYEFEHHFNIPASTAYGYLQQQTQNLLKDYKHALTGPLVRNDTKTLEKNLLSLTHDPYASVYESFVKCYAALKEELSHECA